MNILTNKLVVEYSGDGFFWVRHDSGSPVIEDVWDIEGVAPVEYFRMTRSEAARAFDLWQQRYNEGWRNAADIESLLDSIMVTRTVTFWPDPERASR